MSQAYVCYEHAREIRLGRCMACDGELPQGPLRRIWTCTNHTSGCATGQCSVPRDAGNSGAALEVCGGPDCLWSQQPDRWCPVCDPLPYPSRS